MRERWRTRHVEVINDGNNSVLLLAATAAPATDAFRLRCDHEGLVRHPMDDAPPIDDQPPVVLPPGCRYEFSVDLRCDEASAKVVGVGGGGGDARGLEEQDGARG